MKYVIFVIGMLLGLTVQANEGWNKYAPWVAKASVDANENVEFLAALAAIESSFRVAVKNKDSSAKGLVQFTDRTWRVTLRSYGERYGLDHRSRRIDPYANLVMGAEYVKENRRYMVDKLGRNVSYTELYAAHLLSPQRAVKLVSTPRHYNVAALWPGLAAVNPNLFYHRNGQAKSVREFINTLHRKVSANIHTYGKQARLAVIAHLNQEKQYQRWQRQLKVAMSSHCELTPDELSKMVHVAVIESHRHHTETKWEQPGRGGPASWYHLGIFTLDRRLTA